MINIKKGTIRQAAARAYCSSANLGPGFDSFGLALDAFYDEVLIIRGNKNNNKITISYQNTAKTPGLRSIRGASHARPPTDPDANTAGLVARYMLDENKITDDIKIIIKKGVPAGLGLGSSAASAAAAAAACNALFGFGYDTTGLVKAAGRGEKASAGVIHYDNVAASVQGGFVIARPDYDSVTVAGFKPAPYLRFCIAIPITMKIPDKKTSVSRGVMPKKIALGDCVQNIANASLLATALATGNTTMLGRGITSDAIAEPARKHMIPGFDDVKRAALAAGAREVMISGAGPSIIAIMAGVSLSSSPSKAQQQKIADAMSAGFKGASVGCRTVVCRQAGGAKIIRTPRLSSKR